jgi:Tfp pilus assembly protein PilF
LHASRGDLDTARSQLNGILKANPDDIDTMLTLANVENTAKHQEVAEQILRQVLVKSPKNVAASMALARFALERGDMDAVALHLEAARAADPKAIEPRLSLARLYLNKIEKSGATPELLQSARGPLKEALAVAPKQVDVVLLSAQLEASSGHPEEAKDLLRNAATNDTAAAPIWLELANLQIRAKETSKAYESLNHALSAHPAWLPAVRMIAALHVSEGDIDHALEATRKARDIPGLTGLEAAGQKSGALFLEAEVLSNAATKDSANAAKLWNQAAQTFIQSYTTAPTLQAAMRVMQVRKFAKLPDADACLVTWVATHPSDLKARSALAQYYGDSGERAKAIKVYEEGAAKGSTSAEQLNNLAWAYSENKDARALPTAKQALILSNRKPEVLDTVGWILVQDSKLNDALPYLEEAQKAAPHNPEIAYHAAYTLAHTGNTDVAKHLLAQLLATPDSFPSRKLAEALNTNLSAAGH